MLKRILFICFLITTSKVNAVAKIQGADVKTLAQVGTASLLIGTDKIYDITNTRQLSASISAGIIGASGASMPSAVTTANYTLSVSDTAVDFDTTSNAITATLPTAVGARGKIIRLVKVNSSITNFVTVVPTNSQTVGGASKLVMAALDSVEIISDGSNWKVTVWPTITSSYYNNAGQSLAANTNATVTGWTKLFDATGSFSTGGTYTAQYSGTYHFDGQLASNSTNWAINGVWGSALVKNITCNATPVEPNQTMQTTAEAATAYTLQVPINGTFHLNVGDFVTICVYTTVANNLYASTTDRNHINITREGN